MVAQFTRPTPPPSLRALFREKRSRWVRLFTDAFHKISALKWVFRCQLLHTLRLLLVITRLKRNVNVFGSSFTQSKKQTDPYHGFPWITIKIRNRSNVWKRRSSLTWYYVLSSRFSLDSFELSVKGTILPNYYPKQMLATNIDWEIRLYS